MNIKEHISRVINGEKELNKFIDFMKIKLIEANKGIAKMEIEVRDDFYQGYSFMQGGLIGAVSDECMAYAVLSEIKNDEKQIATVTISHQHIKPVKNGTLKAIANVVKMGRRVAFTECKLYLKDKLVAKSEAVFIIT